MKFQVKIADPTEERKYLYGIIKVNSDGSDGSDGFNMGMGQLHTPQLYTGYINIYIFDRYDDGRNSFYIIKNN